MPTGHRVRWRWRPAVGLALVLVLGCGSEADRLFAIVDASGGDGVDEVQASGGLGGTVSIAMGRSDVLDPGVEIRREGRADTRYAPRIVEPDTGPIELVVDDSFALSILGGFDGSAGEPYMVSGEPRIFISDGNGIPADEPPVTGLRVLPGARFQVPPARFLDLEVSELIFEFDVVNEGRIEAFGRFGDASVDDLILRTRGYVGTGDIRSIARNEGQAGGEVRIVADRYIVHSGEIVTSGADDADAGDVTFVAADDADVFIELSGRIEARGGDQTEPDGAGGRGGHVSLLAQEGLFASADIDVSGGDGVTEAGPGGIVTLVSSPFGAVLHEGGIVSDGGASSLGRGADAGLVVISSAGGRVASDARIQLRGGDSETDFGGDGGTVLFESLDGESERGPGAGIEHAGPIEFSGRIDVTGGEGGVRGGAGGSVLVEHLALNDFSKGTRRVTFFGAGGLVVKGGDSRSPFGSATPGGAISIDVASQLDPPDGPISIAVPIDARGGDSSPERRGARGGSVTLRGGVVDADATEALVNVEGGDGEEPGFPGTFEILP